MDGVIKGMSQINGLLKYMKAIEKELDVSIVIKDFIGFLDMKETLYKQLQEFYIHQTSYCMAIKEQQQHWSYCLEAKDKIYRKLKETKKSFYGYCYAGVGEYVVPIGYNYNDQQVIVGAIVIGGFKHEDWPNNIADKFIGTIIHREDMNELYNQSFGNDEYTKEDMEEKAEVIAEYLSMLYHKEIEQCMVKHSSNSSHSYIISHAIAYIKIHYLDDIKLKHIAEFCHCSTSYISHHFKDLTGATVKSYINELRVEEAKALLMVKEYQVTDIGFMVGFKDSNYFSKVFKDFEDVSPKNYRKHQQ